MTTIAFPAGVSPDTFALKLQIVQREHASPFGGSEQVVDLLNDRWMISMTLPCRYPSEAAAIEAFIASLRGMTNTINLYHWVRKAPRGTMRGSPTVSVPFPMFQADPNVNVQTTAGATLLAGDMIGCNGMLLQVSTDCVADGSGSLNVPIVNRARKGATGGTAVTWDRPTVPFRLMSAPVQVYSPGVGESVALDFAEVI
jgi:hypothetical protein